MRAETDKARLQALIDLLDQSYHEPPDLLLGLPGEAMIREGLADFQSGRCTSPACLVSMARPRLRHAGLVSGTGDSFIPPPIGKGLPSAPISAD